VKSYRHLLALIGAMTVAAPASAALFTFSQSGFHEGASLTGWFEAVDLDNDGQISSFNGEVTDFAASFSGNSAIHAGTFAFHDLNGRVWDMDAVIGDGETGDIEGLSLGDAFYGYVAGPGPFYLCDGVNACAEFHTIASWDNSAELISVTTGAVPEPASWAMMIAGFASAGMMMRRRNAAGPARQPA